MAHISLERKKEIIKECLQGVYKEGFLEWLEEQGYYEAPASATHHGAYPGALFEHSCYVARNLCDMTKEMHLRWGREESPMIVGLLHDICKMDQYIAVKDDYGNVVAYEWNKKQLLTGHGEKSCILALRWIDLTDEELMCIRYHMGAFEGEKMWEKYSDAVAKYPNVLYTHTADMYVSQVMGI